MIPKSPTIVGLFVYKINFLNIMCLIVTKTYIMKTRGFEIVDDQFRKNIDVAITIPTRGSKSSAGYDFYSPVSIEIEPKSSCLVWTDIKAYMLEDEVLSMHIRSSIGIKKGLTLKNTTGIIDADYYNNENNSGNIGVCLQNITDGVISIEAGERISQGIFTKYLVADNGNTESERSGGIGSTNQ